MEYFVWYGIYLILKELKILPEHVPRQHDKVFSIPKDAAKYRSIAFCHCDFAKPIQFCKYTLEVYYKTEYVWHNKKTAQEVTVWLKCPSCGAQGIFSSIHSIIEGHEFVPAYEKAISIAREKLKLQSKGKN